MGQRDGFSNYDIGKINHMYGCNRKPFYGFGSTEIGTTQRPSANFVSNHLTPSSGSHATNAGGNTAGGREDRNPFREIFKPLTSPQFWQKLFGAWFFPQPQPRYRQQQQQIYSDWAYTNNPYFINQGYYG